MKLQALIISILLVFMPFLQSFAAGLRFIGGANYAENTVYEVWPGKSPVFRDCLQLEFDIEIYDYHTVGSIFKLSNNRAQSAGEYVFAYGYCDPESSSFQLNLDRKYSFFSDTLANSSLGPGHWLKVKIGFDLKNDRIAMDICGRQMVFENAGLYGEIEPEIYFGSKLYEEQFAAFSIRNLRISDGATAIGEFPMNENGGRVVHDGSGGKVGRLLYDGEWLINGHYHWKECFSYTSGTVASVNYDCENNSILIVNRDSILTFKPYSGETVAEKLPVPMPMDSKLGTSFYSQEDRSLYVYEVNNLPPDAVTMVKLELDSMLWSICSKDFIMTQRHHHSSIYDDDAYTIFGGFGNRKYFNEFVRYDVNSGCWSVSDFSGDRIAPRFFSASGRLQDGRYLVYGGTGNDSGDELLGLVYYDDLYVVDAEAHTISRKWSHSRTGNNSVPVRSLIVRDSSFYALCYPVKNLEAWLKLYEISVDDGERTQVGDSIFIRSTSILTNANIYENRDRGEIYCVVQEFNDESSSRIRVYSISSPVIAATEVLSAGSRRFCAIAVFWGCVVLAVAGALLFLRLRRRLGRPESDAQHEDDCIHATRNAVFLFGEFAAYDKTGKDVSYLFSAKLYSLFVIILSYTFSEKDGATSSDIADLLWPGRDPQSVKNLKSVTLNKLRNVLEEFTGVEIVYEDKKYSMKCSGEFWCDWIEFVRLNDSYRLGDNSAVKQLRQLLSRGKLFGSASYECLDRLKARYDYYMMSFLPEQLKLSFSSRRYQETIEFANICFNIDPCNEEALSYQIRSLIRMRKADAARKRYLQFCVEYFKITGEEFPVKYESLKNPSVFGQ